MEKHWAPDQYSSSKSSAVSDESPDGSVLLPPGNPDRGSDGECREILRKQHQRNLPGRIPILGMEVQKVKQHERLYWPAASGGTPKVSCRWHF